MHSAALARMLASPCTNDGPWLAAGILSQCSFNQLSTTMGSGGEGWEYHAHRAVLWKKLVSVRPMAAGRLSSTDWRGFPL